jgi:hypothetical protein
LSAVETKQGDMWARVMVSGNMMFDWVDLPLMAQLVWAVVQANLGNFFPAPQPISK